MTDTPEPLIVQKLRAKHGYSDAEVLILSDDLINPNGPEAAATIVRLEAVLQAVQERFDWQGHTTDEPGCPSCELYAQVTEALASLHPVYEKGGGNG